MNRVLERFVLPSQIEAGPHKSFLGWLLVALQAALGEIGRRLNLMVPKDGSELIQMTSFDSTSFAMAADVNNADTGYYGIVKCMLTGANRTLTGIANGAGPEGAGGRVITLVNASASNLILTLAHNDAGSDAANRIYLPRQLPVAIHRYMALTLWYDLADQRWRVL